MKYVIDMVFRTTGFDSMLDYTVVDSNTDYSHMSFKEFLAQKVKYGPDKTILSAGGESYNWKEIEESSQIIANDLEKLRIGKRTHAALCGANSINWVLTFYALQKLGAIVILLNSNL